MRLARHDELVEAMAGAMALLHGYKPYESSWPEGDNRLGWKLFEDDATAALDALLAAVVEMGVGLGFVDVSGPSGLQFRYPTARETPNTLILQLEEPQHGE